jgi:hypothetical protein
MVLPAYVDQEYGIDLIIPFIFRDKTLQETNVSAVIIQSKNDKRFTATPTHYLFKMMRLYHIRFFNRVVHGSHFSLHFQTHFWLIFIFLQVKTKMSQKWIKK